MIKFSDEWLRHVDAGMVKNAEIVYKFGRLAGGMTTSFQPVTSDAFYRTPTTPVTLEIVSDSIEDAVGGTGGNVVHVEGLDENWRWQKVDVTLDGLTPVAITGSWLRVFRMRLTDSHVYANEGQGSHVGNVVIRETGAGQEWASMNIDGGFGIGTSLIGCFTVPLGYTAHIIDEQLFTETAKPVDVILTSRDCANITTPPYKAMHWEQVHFGTDVAHTSSPRGLGEELVGPHDIGYLCKSATAGATCAVMFQILLIKVY